MRRFLLTFCVFVSSSVASLAVVYYEPTYPPLTGSVITAKPWGTIWQCNGTQRVMQDTVVPSATSTTVEISSARNEHEPFQLVLRANKPLTNVRCTPRTLVGPNGAKIAAWNVEVRNVEYVNITERYSHDGYTTGGPIGWHPDPLPPFTPFSASSGRNYPIWITVYVPKDVPSGSYTGSVDITGRGMSRISVPVNLHVWNFNLPAVSKFKTAYQVLWGYVEQYQHATTLEQKRKLVDLYNVDFKNHRVSPYTPYAYREPVSTVVNGHTVVDFTDFDKAIQKYFSWFNSYMLPGGSTEYMHLLAEHLAAKGQLDNGYVYISDEPAPADYPGIVAAANLLRQADPRIKILLTEQVEDALIGSVDIWCPFFTNYDETRSKARQALGEQVWTYLACAPMHPYPANWVDYPAIDMRMTSWICWRYGITGLLYWGTTYWDRNPWTTPMTYTSYTGWGNLGNGEGSLQYPPTKTASSTFVEKPPIPSIRWEMIREGVEDYDYFIMLREKIDQAKAVNPANPAIAVGESALSQINVNAPNMTLWQRDPVNLLALRTRIAQAIEGLN